MPGANLTISPNSSIQTLARQADGSDAFLRCRDGVEVSGKLAGVITDAILLTTGQGTLLIMPFTHIIALEIE